MPASVLLVAPLALHSHSFHRRACVSMSLHRTLAGDVAAGALATVLSAPLIVTADRAMTLNAAGEQPLWPALKEGFAEIPRRPLAFVKSEPFLWVWFAYGITYVFANAFISVGLPTILQLLAITAINSAVCIAKDARFAQLFGNEADRDTPRPLPRSSFIAFCARDLVTMAFVFTLPVLIQRRFTRLPELALRFATPLACQYVTAPFYLLGLAFYNLPGSPLRAQLTSVRTAYQATVLTRQARAVAQYSISNVANARLRVLFASIF